MDKTIRIASFDPGKKNFAFCVEEFKAIEIQKFCYKKRYFPNGTIQPEFKTIVDKICLNGDIIMFKNTDLTEKCTHHSYLEDEYLHNLTDLLDDHSDIWDTCETFIIEKQMSFGKKHNTMALKIAQHCWSYFAFKYGRFKKIIEFPAYYKTQTLGAEKIKKETKTGKITYKTVDKPVRKKWSIQKAICILDTRKDTNTLSCLTSTKKKDDLADVLCQLQAYKILTYIKDIE